MQFNDDSSYVRGLLFVPPVYVANFNKSINRDLNDENKTQQPFISLFYIAIAYNSIHDLTAQLHSELVRYRPTRNSAKAGIYAFYTS